MRSIWLFSQPQYLKFLVMNEPTTDANACKSETLNHTQDPINFVTNETKLCKEWKICRPAAHQNRPLMMTIENITLIHQTRNQRQHLTGKLLIAGKYRWILRCLLQLHKTRILGLWVRQDYAPFEEDRTGSGLYFSPSNTTGSGSGLRSEKCLTLATDWNSIATAFWNREKHLFLSAFLH